MTARYHIASRKIARREREVVIHSTKHTRITHPSGFFPGRERNPCGPDLSSESRGWGAGEFGAPGRGGGGGMVVVELFPRLEDGADGKRGGGIQPALRTCLPSAPSKHLLYLSLVFSFAFPLFNSSLADWGKEKGKHVTRHRRPFPFPNAASARCCFRIRR